MAKSGEKDKPLNHRIGYNVMRARRRRGFTIPMLADRAGVHKNTLDRVEKGYGATASTLFKLALALEVSLDELAQKSQYVVGFSAGKKKAAKVVSGIINFPA